MSVPPPGRVYAIEYQYRTPVKSDKNGRMDIGFGSAKLAIKDINQLSNVLPCRQGDKWYGLSYSLNQEQAEALSPLLEEPIEFDFEEYEYYLDGSDSLEILENRRQEFYSSLPAPESVFALDVIEKGKEVGFGVMPLFKVDIELVREYCKMKDSDNFDFDDRIDQDFLKFIQTMQSCKNINLDKYDYRPSIWANVFEQEENEINIINCEEQ